MSEPKVLEFLHNVGILTSPGEVSNLLTKHQTGFHTEKAAIYEAGLRSSPWQHVDDTLTWTSQSRPGKCHQKILVCCARI